MEYLCANFEAAYDSWLLSASISSPWQLHAFVFLPRLPVKFESPNSIHSSSQPPSHPDNPNAIFLPSSRIRTPSAPLFIRRWMNRVLRKTAKLRNAISRRKGWRDGLIEISPPHFLAINWLWTFEFATPLPRPPLSRVRLSPKPIHAKSTRRRAVKEGTDTILRDSSYAKTSNASECKKLFLHSSKENCFQ